MPQRFNILIVDDEESLTTILREELQRSSTYEVDLAFDGVEAINLIQKKLYDVVLLDFKMPRVDGKEVLKFVQEHSPASQAIILSSFADLQLAVEMTKLGAYDVLRKPYDINELEQNIARALERKKLSTENKLLQEELQRKAGSSEVIGNSKAMLDVLSFAKRVAESDSVVLILGASGTGKEVIANYIHKHSLRYSNPFVPVNCSSIPDALLESELFGHEKGAFTNAYAAKPGLVEMANGGTLFLDEVGDISQTVQPKLLRFLENGTFRRVGGTNELHANVRVLSATNKNLQEESRLGKFREDLLYRLNVFTIKMPFLKDHLDDIPELVDFFLQKKSKSRQPKKICKEALNALMMYNWPGNIRELEHVIERAIILSSGDIIETHDLHLTDHQPE
ncbi:MAG: sigma-54-dependent Fis family transcriptional regulator, partial [Bacteroidetes bacterium]